jgi:hypothetical protein
MKTPALTQLQIHQLMIYYFKMKKYYLILFGFAFCYTTSSAQINRTLQLTGYNNNVSIIIKDKIALFISKGDTTKVAIVTEKNLLNISTEDEKKAVQVLAFSDKNILTVSQKYTEAYPGLSYTEQLINKAKALGGSMVITKEVNATAVLDTATQVENIGSEEEDVPLQNLETKRENNLMHYLWIPFAILSSVFALLWFTNKNKKVETQDEGNSQNNGGKLNTDTTPEQQVHQQQIQQLQTKIQELNTQLHTAANKDQKFYSALLSGFLLPAKQALENGNHASASELMVASLYHTIAKANEQQGNRSQSDVANMQTLETGLLSAIAKNITKETNADAIPQEIKNVIIYLKNNGADQLAKTTILDHSITNL